MNCVFQDDEMDNGFFNILQSDHHVPADPTTKITKNATTKLDDANAVDMLKIENEDKSITKLKDKEEIKIERNRSKTEDADLWNQDDKRDYKEKEGKIIRLYQMGREKDIQLFQTLKQI